MGLSGFNFSKKTIRPIHWKGSWLRFKWNLILHMYRLQLLMDFVLVFCLVDWTTSLVEMPLGFQKSSPTDLIITITHSSQVNDDFSNNRNTSMIHSYSYFNDLESILNSYDSQMIMWFEMTSVTLSNTYLNDFPHRNIISLYDSKYLVYIYIYVYYVYIYIYILYYIYSISDI